MKFNHIGIPTTTRFEGEIDLPHLRVTVSDHQSNPFGIQWQRYWEGAPVPDLVKTVAHVAFEVDDLELALRGQEVIISPNSPSAGVVVAFIKVAGAPVELLQIDRTIRSDLKQTGADQLSPRFTTGCDGSRRATRGGGLVLFGTSYGRSR